MTRSPDGATRIEGWLSGAGAAYSIIEPMVRSLSEHLDTVTGDPQALREDARDWQFAATKLIALADEEEAARRALLACWEGQAAEAFAAQLSQANTSLREMAAHFEQTGELLLATADGVEQAEELIAQIIKELIAWLIITIIVALASSYITFGASVAAGGAAARSRGSGRCPQMRHGRRAPGPAAEGSTGIPQGDERVRQGVQTLQDQERGDA